MVHFHVIEFGPSRELLDQGRHTLGVTAVGVRCGLFDQTGENVAVDPSPCRELVASGLHFRQGVEQGLLLEQIDGLTQPRTPVAVGVAGGKPLDTLLIVATHRKADRRG